MAPGARAGAGAGAGSTGAGVAGAESGNRVSVRQELEADVTDVIAVRGVGCAKSDGYAFANAACARSSSDG